MHVTIILSDTLPSLSRVLFSCRHFISLDQIIEWSLNIKLNIADKSMIISNSWLKYALALNIRNQSQSSSAAQIQTFSLTTFSFISDITNLLIQPIISLYFNQAYFSISTNHITISLISTNYIFLFPIMSFCFNQSYIRISTNHITNHISSIL